MVFQVIIPIFFLLALGYASVKVNLLSQDQVKAVGAFVLKIALPALLFQSLATKDLNEIWLPEFFIVYTLVTIVLFAVAYLLVSRYFDNAPTHVPILALGASMSNTGLLGTAVLTLLMGQKAMTYVSLVVIMESVLLIPAVLIMAELGSKSDLNIVKVIQETFKTLLTSPLTLSVFFGIACSMFNVHLPMLIESSLVILGQSASSLALFTIGGGIVGMTLKHVNAQTFYLVFSNNFLMPLLVFTGLYYFTQASREVIFAATIIASLPMPTIFGMLGQAYGAGDKTMTPLLMSTIAGFAVASVVIAILGQ